MERLECICGRLGVHCVSCGVSNIYNLKRLDVKTNNLETFPLGRVRGFRCRKCGVEFRENSDCTAPASREQIASTANKIMAPLSTEECLKNLAIIRKLGPQYEPYAHTLEESYKQKGWL